MTKTALLLQIKQEIRELMGCLSIREIMFNQALPQQIEVVMREIERDS